MVAKDQAAEEFETCPPRRPTPLPVLLVTSMANDVGPCLPVRHLPCNHPVAIALLEGLAIIFSSSRHKEDILVVDTESVTLKEHFYLAILFFP